MEIWRGVKYGGVDYSNWLEVTKDGKIRNPKTGVERKQNLLHTGYCFVSFSMGSRCKKKTIRVHKAVAETFIPNPHNYPQVNHIDGCKTNNKVENLEWVTNSQNVQHSLEIGLRSEKYKIEELFTNEEILYIKENTIKNDKEFSTRKMAKKFNTNHYVINKVLQYK
jgi:hypothetical protein